MEDDWLDFSIATISILFGLNMQVTIWNMINFLVSNKFNNYNVIWYEEFSIWINNTSKHRIQTIANTADKLECLNDKIQLVALIKAVFNILYILITLNMYV